MDSHQCATLQKLCLRDVPGPSLRTDLKQTLPVVSVLSKQPLQFFRGAAHLHHNWLRITKAQDFLALCVCIVSYKALRPHVFFGFGAQKPYNTGLLGYSEPYMVTNSSYSDAWSFHDFNRNSSRRSHPYTRTIFTTQPNLSQTLIGACFTALSRVV